MSILQKEADFIFAMDKMKSAFYNAFYTAGIQMLYHLSMIGITGESKVPERDNRYRFYSCCTDRSKNSENDRGKKKN